jgi:uncharacterized protein YkwD
MVSTISRMLRLLPLVFLLSVPLVPRAQATLTADERTRASQLFQACRAALAAGERDAAEQAISELVDDLPSDAAAMACKPLEDETRKLLAAFRRDAAALLARHSAADRLKDPRVAEARATLAAIRSLGSEDEMKKRLASDGQAAMRRLQEILLPDPTGILDQDPALAATRSGLETRLVLIDRLRDAAVLGEDSSLRDTMAAATGGFAGLEQIAAAECRKVLQANEPILAELPPAEAAGIRDLNRMRVLLGLNALAADPKLCLASRDHSKDMAERGFFAHDSPVPGKKSPWDRARLAGTSAGAENIAAGQATGEGANQAWFHSPGHHKNMFAGHRRVGLGNHGQHWTQMFGG